MEENPLILAKSFSRIKVDFCRMPQTSIPEFTNLLNLASSLMSAETSLCRAGSDELSLAPFSALVEGEPLLAAVNTNSRHG